MQINTKFNIDDKVFTIDNHSGTYRIQECIIKKIYITAEYNDYYIANIATVSYDLEYERYSDSMVSNFKIMSVPETSLFKTKEELINSL